MLPGPDYVVQTEIGEKRMRDISVNEASLYCERKKLLGIISAGPILMAVVVVTIVAAMIEIITLYPHKPSRRVAKEAGWKRKRMQTSSVARASKIVRNR